MKMNKILSLVVTAALAVSTLGTALPVLADSVSGNNGNTSMAVDNSAGAPLVTINQFTAKEYADAGLAATDVFVATKVQDASKLYDKAQALDEKAEIIGLVDIKIGDGTKTKLNKAIPVTITVDVGSDMLQASDIVVIREHDGKIDVLPCDVVGHTVSFYTDRFSSYAVALLPKGSFYKAGNGGSSAPAQNPAEPPVDSVPKTGEQLPIVLLGLTVLSAIGCALTFKKKEQN